MTHLLDDIDVLETSGDPTSVDVLGVEHDSRRVAPGDLFFCLPGTVTDGHAHAAEAVARGAVGLVCERAVDPPVARPVVSVRVGQGGARPAMARAAAAFFGRPAQSLLTAGVTGTNGKTTVVHLLRAVLEHAGHPAVVVGTLTGARTTPEANDLQRLLAEVRDGRPPGAARPAVAMEVSSHALAQARVEGIRFDVAVFTNLSHEHLDFHGSMEAYFAAKAVLFEREHAAAAVVNVDDPWGRRLAASAAVPTVEVRAGQAARVRLEVGGSRFAWRGHEVRVAASGTLNVANALLAAEAAVVLGVPPEVVAAGLGTAGPVPGRLEAVPTGGAGFDVLVDYAHTPVALEAVLGECRRLAAARAGRVLVVFGCGGERDPSKRPVMGEVASRLADVVVVTSDNPRREDPGSIIAQVVAGTGPGDVLVEPDRRAAIAVALARAAAGDVVLVAGKGHETAQVLADRVVPFDDRLVVGEELARLGSGERARPA